MFIRDPEARFLAQATLCTDPTREPAQILGWFVQRWIDEINFQEARANLGVETQLQWSYRWYWTQPWGYSAASVAGVRAAAPHRAARPRSSCGARSGRCNDTIGGQSSDFIANPYGKVAPHSNGTNLWTV